MKQRILTGSAFFILFLMGLFLQTQAYAESCEKVVHAFNARLSTIRADIGAANALFFPAIGSDLRQT